MFDKLFGKQAEAEVPAAAASVTLSGDYDVSASFENGALVLSGDGFRLRLDKASALMLGNKVSMARRFAEVESPNRGVFDLAKTCRIAHLLGHGLDMAQVGRLLGERADDVRAYYAWSLSQGAWSDAPAQAERERLAEGDRVRSTRGIPGGVIKKDGRLCSAQTGVPVQEQFARLVGANVARTLRENRDNIYKTAEALRIDPGDFGGWLERNQELLAVLK